MVEFIYGNALLIFRCELYAYIFVYVSKFYDPRNAAEKAYTEISRATSQGNARR
jgi:hypothetical protein